jgi:methylphosphotriester-DNA--protein-cysteine methyltransferase
MKAPIIQYVRTKKILAAHKMIEGGSKPYQVAKELGFDDYSTFYRCYVSIIGSAPANSNSKKIH